MSDRDIKITKEDAELASYFDSDTVHKFKLVRIK